MTDTKLLVGHKIKFIREMQNISQDYLAQSLKISQVSLSKIENNQLSISFERLCSIAEALEVSVNVIINFDKQDVFRKCGLPIHNGCTNFNEKKYD